MTYEVSRPLMTSVSQLANLAWHYGARLAIQRERSRIRATGEVAAAAQMLVAEAERVPGDRSLPLSERTRCCRITPKAAVSSRWRLW